MRARWIRAISILAAMLLVASSMALVAGSALAQTDIERELPPGLQIPDAALPGPNFDAEQATQAYLNLLTPEQRAKSDAYFEGGYWLQLWGLLYGLGVAALLLYGGISRRMRDFARGITARPWLYTMIYVLLWVVVGFVLWFPASLYIDYFREHQYGLSNHTFGSWMGDNFKDLMVSAIVLPIVLAGLYAAVRRAGERWWMWATALTFVFIMFFSAIAPVFIRPLFNDFKPLPEGQTRESILALARANQIPSDNVYWFDASRQTKRVSANVSGFAGTMRISLNDNLLNKTSEPEIEAVMGHEMGHYVLNHAFRLPVYLTVVFGFGFWFVHRSFDGARRRWGTRWGVTGRDDPAGLPLAVALFSLYLFLATPLTNSIVRQAEAEADNYGLNAARQPHGFAMAAMRLSTYRKINPGPWEEIIFYDHPSGYARVKRSMTWFQEHQNDIPASAAVAATP
jgi:STE24 endopeptidase